jgi:hypothetical protein
MAKNDDEDRAERRVLDFINDYSVWSQFNFPDISCPFEESLTSPSEEEAHLRYEDHQKKMAEGDLIAEKHWLDPSKMSRSLSSPPRHAPELETIHSVEVKGNEALVSTTYCQHLWVERREYRLKRVGLAWKIDRLFELRGDDTIPEASSPSLLKLPYPKKFGPADVSNMELSLAFQNRAFLHGPGKVGPISVREVGKLEIPSGRLVVHDSGHLDEAQPLALSLPKGQHPVTISGNDYALGAVRVHWGRLEDIVGYVPLPQLGKAAEHYYASVDRGSIAIADAQYILGLTSVERSRVWNEAVETRFDKRRSEAFQFLGKSLIEVSPEGGSGSYPCYVGIDDKGEPLCFVMDFCAYGFSANHQCDCRYDLSMADGRIRNHLLDEFEFLPIHHSRMGNTLTLTSPAGQHITAHLLDKDGNVLDKTENHGSVSTMEGNIFQLLLPDDFNAGVIRFLWNTWKSDLEMGPDGKLPSIDPKHIPYYNGENTPSLSELIRLMKAIPSLTEVARIAEAEAKKDPGLAVRIMTWTMPAKNLASNLKGGLSAGMVRGVGYEKAIQALREQETLVVTGGFQSEDVGIELYFECHTGKLLAGIVTYGRDN